MKGMDLKLAICGDSFCADYGKNPLSLFPFFVTGILGVVVAVLIFSKKRS